MQPVSDTQVDLPAIAIHGKDGRSHLVINDPKRL